jgi:predicted AlkP superfamily pyrophosphatase or phosphodiesterase
VLGARGRVVAVIASMVGLPGVWAIFTKRLLTLFSVPGGAERHASIRALDRQCGRGGARKVRRRLLFSLPIVGVLLALAPAWGPIQEVDASNASPIQHVLVISIDGMHALDLSNYVKSHPNSTLATLSSSGNTFSNAASSEPSNAFPGLLAMTTGGAPRTTGVWYENAYDRNLSAPGSNCSTKGTAVVYDESIDFDPTKIDGGGGINPANLPLDGSKGCTPVYPHSFLRVNTVFEVVKAAGDHTAWAADHPSYDILNGPSGTGVEDLYTPEISSIDGTVAGTEAYDNLKVAAVLNETDGKDHTGTKTEPVPTVFGMNFAAVNVAQQVAGGGYLDAQGTPSPTLAGAFDHVDHSLGTLVNELSTEHLLQSTLIIITADHGQAPIDPSKRLIVNNRIIPNLVNSVQAGLLAQATQDDVSLLWLNDQSKTSAVVASLTANSAQAHLDSILSGAGLISEFGDPLNDPRVPDIIGVPTLGAFYGNTTSTKIAAHGGLSDDDTHVPLLVSNPILAKTTVNTAVTTTQVAPTILSLLGLDPSSLQAVMAEATPVLPLVTDSDLALTVPSDQTLNATGPGGATVAYTVTASDENLATVTVTCSPKSGSTFAIGTTTVTCTATDTDGDANSPVQKTFNVHVKGAPEQLSDLANMVNGVGPGTSLGGKIGLIQSTLAAGDRSGACGTLTAFINQVNAQSGKSIPPTTAATLIADAQRIETVIPCSS